MENVPFWMAVALLFAGLAVRIARRLRSDDDDDDHEEDAELRHLRRKRDAVREMSRSSDDASKRSDRVEELCARGELVEAGKIYDTLRRDAETREELAWGVGFALAAAGGELGTKRIEVSDLTGARAIVEDLVRLARRTDLGAHEGMGLVPAMSGLADAWMDVGDLDTARLVVTIQARGVELAPMLEMLHAATVKRLLTAYVDAGRGGDARRAHDAFVVRGTGKIEIDAALLARIPEVSREDDEEQGPMRDHCTIYLSRRLTSDDVRSAHGEGVIAGVGEVLATVRIGRVQITLNDMPAAKRAQHLQGLAGYVRARLPTRQPDVFDRISGVDQVVGMVIEPGFDAEGEVAAFIASLAQQGGGFIFRNPDLVDPEGTLLAGVPAEADVAAPADDDDEPEEEDTQPPTAERVLRRAWALAAVSWRGLFETRTDPAERREAITDMRAWVAKIGLADELEPEEAEILAVPEGDLGDRALADATWRVEGVAVLAWALGVADLPDHETMCTPFDVFRAIGFLKPLPATLDPPRLRTPDEIERQGRRLLGIHWRLREFGVTGKPTNLRALAAGKIWFGGFDLDGIALNNDDLAIAGKPISEAEAGALRSCSSIALERHRAVDWLQGAASIYSEVNPST